MLRKNVAPLGLSSKKSTEFTNWTVGADYEPIKLLGRGSYGAVCSALHLPTQTKVAIKRMDNVFEDEIDCKRILREVNLLK